MENEKGVLKYLERCSTTDCNNKAMKGNMYGVCSSCYRKTQSKSKKPCSLIDCNNSLFLKGLCRKHYKEQRKEKVKTFNSWLKEKYRQSWKEMSSDLVREGNSKKMRQDFRDYLIIEYLEYCEANGYESEID